MIPFQSPKLHGKQGGHPTPNDRVSDQKCSPCLLHAFVEGWLEAASSLTLCNRT